MPRKASFANVVLLITTLAIFFAECTLFHFPLSVGFDAFVLALMIVMPGVLLVLLITSFSRLGFSSPEQFSIAIALGFGLFPVLLSFLHLMGIPSGGLAWSAPTFIVFCWFLNPKMRKEYFPEWWQMWKLFLIFAAGSLLFFAAYNFQQFHYLANGSIMTRGLFGVDLPFLAGEIHGIRNFGVLRDLHQSALAWHYHDWTYQLLSLLDRNRTVPDLAFAAPLIGYTFLAFSVYTLAMRLTASRYLAFSSVLLWFLVSGIDGGELGSYALSPSFVFGSILFVNLLLVFDLRMNAKERNAQWTYSGIFFLLLIALSQTKLSTYLTIVASVVLLSLIGLIVSRNKRRMRFELLFVSLVSFGIVLLQNAGSNPFMPGEDFVIGAPLLGYANHLAAILHVALASVNPVSSLRSMRWQTLLAIPFFLVHVLRFSCTDPKLISALLLVIVFRKQLWNRSSELTWILVLLIPIGFLLPVLYSPAWYPLAFSFYAPLVSTQSALLLVVVAFGTFLQTVREKNTQRSLLTPRSLLFERATIGIVSIVLLVGVCINLGDMLRSDSEKRSVISPELIQAMTYLSEHSAIGATIATKRYDVDTSHDESFYWYAALSGRTIVSEGAKYGSLLSSVADTNSEKGLHSVAAAAEVLAVRRAELDTIFDSDDSISVHSALLRSGATYILEGNADSEQMHLRVPSMLVPQFSNGAFKVWKVR